MYQIAFKAMKVLWQKIYIMPLFILSSENKKSRKRRRGEDEEDDSSRYEKNARTQFAGDNNQRMKMLLPIKDKGRVIPQMVEIEEMEEDEEEVEETSQSKGMIWLCVLGEGGEQGWIAVVTCMHVCACLHMPIYLIFFSPGFTQFHI